MNFKKRRSLKKSLNKYYSSYYNENYIRDFRFIYDDNRIHKFPDILNRKKNTGDRRIALTFLSRQKHEGFNGTLLHELSYFKSLDEYKKANNNERYSDRLFFDFDIEDDRVVNIKKGMKEIIDTEDDVDTKEATLEEFKSDFRSLIFDEDLILPTFNEASSLCEYLEEQGLKPYLIFSGSKGFHVHIFFNELKLNNISNISYSLANSFKKKLDLKYMDLGVNKDAMKRSQRVQYSYHSKTNLLTQPLSRDLLYDEVLSVIEKNKRKPIEFNIEDYKAPEEFNNNLIKFNNSISVRLQKRKKELDIINKERRERAKRKYNGQIDSLRDINMKELVKAYGIEGKEYGEGLTIRCPFHDDKHPSAVVFDKVFYCHTCDMSLNYYDFISKMENTTTKSNIMKKVDELVSN